MEVVGHTATSTELQEQSSFGSIFYHTHSQAHHHIQQWGLENHRLPHFHVLPLTHKLHFFYLPHLFGEDDDFGT